MKDAPAVVLDDWLAIGLNLYGTVQGEERWCPWRFVSAGVIKSAPGMLLEPGMICTTDLGRFALGIPVGK